VGDQDATEAYGLHPRLSRDALVSQLAAFSDPKDMDALVFTTADGTHIGQHAFRRTLAPLLAATTPPQTGTECARRREIGSCQGKPDLGAKLRHESKRLLERSRAEGLVKVPQTGSRRRSSVPRSGRSASAPARSWLRAPSAVNDAVGKARSRPTMHRQVTASFSVISLSHRAGPRIAS
jgi:hypothetical protein